jgi:hypothetical protein
VAENTNGGDGSARDAAKGDTTESARTADAEQTQSAEAVQTAVKLTISRGRRSTLARNTLEAIKNVPVDPKVLPVHYFVLCCSVMLFGAAGSCGSSNGCSETSTQPPTVH